MSTIHPHSVRLDDETFAILTEGGRTLREILQAAAQQIVTPDTPQDADHDADQRHPAKIQVTIWY